MFTRKGSVVAYVISFLGLINIFISSSASANDSKVFHGTECMPFYGYQIGDFRYQQNFLYNSTTQSRNVICPVVRDNDWNSPGLDYVLIQVYVNSSSDTVTCSFYNHDTNGLGFMARTVSRTGSGSMTISPFNGVNNFGSYSLRCNLPKYSGIVRYSIDER